MPLRAEMRWLWGDWRIPRKSKFSKPLSAVAVQSGWVLSLRMASTGSFWMMRGSKEEQRKRGCILKRSRSRSRVSGFLHKSCTDREESEWIHAEVDRFLLYLEGKDVKWPQWAGGQERSWGSWAGRKENLWPCPTWSCGPTLQEVETGKKIQTKD